MDDHPHELEFTTGIASWINRLLLEKPSLPFAEAKCESRGLGSLLRRDLSLIGKDGQILVTGEIKLPYRKNGGSPLNHNVVKDARLKAKQAKARYFFTWNVNECVLWETASVSDDPLASQPYRSWHIATITKPAQLTHADTQAAIKGWLGQFLGELADILEGRSKLAVKAPDERFIEALEMALNIPIRLTWEELESRYTPKRGKAELDAWMRDELGWTIQDDPEGIRDILERAAKFACYALMNKLVFYEALLRHHGDKLNKLNVENHIDRGDDLRIYLEGVFAIAKNVTGDYETVFGEDYRDISKRIPFYADAVVNYWREFIEQIHVFDFSTLDYEIIGNIFERLISPEERHKFGQFYTRAEVVDLINSFCIRTGNETVLDPACGGGTFLVRAYVRKRELNPDQSHEKLLKGLYGVDISPFACHLATINLASRNLIKAENYPRIVREDFFNIAPDQRFVTLPKHTRQAKGLGKVQHQSITLPALDAVIGNPPYVRQEDIKSHKNKNGNGNGNGPPPGTKEYYRQLALEKSSARLSGRSDLHCYFWAHAANFIKKDGWLCFLTSSQWLDVEYGFRLQEWILSRFKVVALFESGREPWFVGARVVTTATILQRCDNHNQRDANIVRFVRLHAPLEALLKSDHSVAGTIIAAERFRDEILSLTGNTVNPHYRARLVPQRELLAEGVRMGRVLHNRTEEPDEENADDHEEASKAEYYGCKWGIYLRAPDLWFEFADRFADRLVPLGELAEIRFGVKSGKDEFFFPKDASLECLAEVKDPAVFGHEFGVLRERVESGEVKLVRCGEKYGEVRPIEAKYLEPEVHSLMEIKGFTVKPENCARLILLVSEPKEALAGSYVLKYLEWGEERGWHLSSTCAARGNRQRQWYDLTGHQRGVLFWPMAQQYKHAIPSNDQNLIANHNLFDIFDDKVEADVLGGILNSSWVIMSKFQFGRPVGNEGNLKTEVIDVKMMPVPDPRRADPQSLQRVAESFAAMKPRNVLQLLPERRLREMAYRKGGRDAELDELSGQSEFDMPDRHDLDDAVLEMLGMGDPQERGDYLRQLYDYLRAFFEDVRHKEETAIEHKNRSKRRLVNSPSDIADKIIEELTQRQCYLLNGYHQFANIYSPYTMFRLPLEGRAELNQDMFAHTGSVRFLRGRRTIELIATQNPEQAAIIAQIANDGLRGFVPVPNEPEACQILLQAYATQMAERNLRLRQLIAERTADADLQEAIFEAAVRKLTVSIL